MQTQSADEFRGRVMSLHQFTWGSMALGSLMMGAFAEGIGIPVTIAIGGGVVVVSGMLVAIWMFRPRPESALDTSVPARSVSRG